MSRTIEIVRSGVYQAPIKPLSSAQGQHTCQPSRIPVECIQGTASQRSHPEHPTGRECRRKFSPPLGIQNSKDVTFSGWRSYVKYISLCGESERNTFSIDGIAILCTETSNNHNSGNNNLLVHHSTSSHILEVHSPTH